MMIDFKKQSAFIFPSKLALSMILYPALIYSRITFRNAPDLEAIVGRFRRTAQNQAAAATGGKRQGKVGLSPLNRHLCFLYFLVTLTEPIFPLTSPVPLPFTLFPPYYLQ